jgi:FkbM family methyltransferase
LTFESPRPRGIVARLRHQAGPRLPAFLRRAGARVLDAVERRRGASYDVAGHRLRFIQGSAPSITVRGSDERSALDALQLTSFAQSIRPGDVVADVGSYRGTYAVVAAACAGAHGRVYAFEPTAANQQIIRANLALNNLDDRVVVEGAAVSERTGSALFYAWGDATTNSLAQTQEEAGAVEVRTIALDEYFAGLTLPRVLKIDIEGAELLALRGAQRILASDAAIICELHPYAWEALGYGADDLRALLEKYGRVTTDLATGDEVKEYRYGAVWLAKR